MATAGELSSSLAHELRQPLTAILANAEAAQVLLTRDGVDLREVRAILEDIAEQDKFAANVIGRLRSLLEKEEPHFEMLAMETTVGDALALSRGTVERSGVQVETQIAPGLPRVRGDPVQLLQVVLNLVVNGCESMSATPAPDRRLRLRVARQDSEYVEVLIADSGTGLPQGREDRVFEPFFTTKKTGLGQEYWRPSGQQRAAPAGLGRDPVEPPGRWLVPRRAIGHGRRGSRDRGLVAERVRARGANVRVGAAAVRIAG